MKRRVLVLAILVFGLGLSPGHTHAEVIACLGDSNTFGEGLLDRTHESYPAQLEMLLQQQNMNWEVRNFGVSGATVLRQGDIPYEYQDAFYEALASEPDYVIFCFGANGSRSENREYIRAHYVSDYLSLIDSFLALPHEPRILICHPLKAFSDIYSFSDVVIRDEIIPRIAEVASARNIPCVDLYAAFENSSDLCQSDGIHPTSAGAGLMAEMVAAALLGAIAPPDYNGDGRVDMDDLVMLVESWGKYDPVVDTTPPFGDGAVDVQDLELLMSYWQESVDDPTLVAHWTLDEEGGTAALDEVSGNKDAVVGGAVWHSNAGRVNGAIQLDGVDDAVVVDRVVSLAHRPLSIVTWIRGGAVGQTIISERGEANWLSAGPSDGALMTGPDDVTADGGPLQSAVVITEGEWHRIGLVWDGSQRMLYVDGSMVAADQPDEMHVHASGLYIGCGMDATAGTYWSGMIDDVRIYRRALKL